MKTFSERPNHRMFASKNEGAIRLNHEKFAVEVKNRACNLNGESLFMQTLGKELAGRENTSNNKGPNVETNSGWFLFCFVSSREKLCS